MIITKTPFRMSFFGGGTDIPDFFNQYGGSVISTTFDKYCYVIARHLPPFFDYSDELVYSRIERVGDPAEFEHPLMRGAMEMLRMKDMRVNYDGDLPARSGLGTSSSFAVGLLNAFHCTKGTYASKERLAKEAIYLERAVCGEAGGWQDQVAASYGGLNRIDFSKDSFTVTPIVISGERKKQLERNLLLFFTGFTRFSSEMQKTNKVTNKVRQLQKMLDLVDEAQEILTDKKVPLSRFGELLDASWKLKRGTGKNISSSSIDDLYLHGISAGALGGKLLGAGGGGFLLFYVEPDAQQSVRSSLDGLLEIPFKFEDSGTSVAYFEPEDYCEMGAIR